MMSLDIYRDHTGIDRVLGCRPCPEGLVCAPWYADSDLVPEDQWREIDEAPSEIAIKDQDGIGACNAFAMIEGVEEGMIVAGLPHVPLDPWMPYADLCGGIDRGSSIAEGLTYLRDKGACREGLVPYGEYRPARIPQQARQSAAYKLEIGARLPQSFAAIMSAVQRRQQVNFSLSVNGGFDDLDSDGVIQSGPGAGNHALSTCLRAKRHSRTGEWLLGFRNHWTAQWGLKGYAYAARRHIENQRFFDAYVLRAVVAPDPDNPPIAS